MDKDRMKQEDKDRIEIECLQRRSRNMRRFIKGVTIFVLTIVPFGIYSQVPSIVISAQEAGKYLPPIFDKIYIGLLITMWGSGIFSIISSGELYNRKI